MLRGIVNRALGSRRRPAAGGSPRPAAGGRAGTGSANRDIEQGAKSLVRGIGKKRRGGL